MKILLLAQWYEPVIGGEEIHVRTLGQELAARGHTVVVAALSHPDRPAQYWDGPVDVRRIRGSLQRIPGMFSDRARQSTPPLPDPGVSAALRRLVRAVRPDVVHAHNWIVYSYLPVKDSAIPLVLTLHDYSLTCATKVRLYQGRLCSGPGVQKCLRCVSGHYGPLKGPVTLAGLWGMHPAVRGRVDCIVSVSNAVERDNQVSRYARRHLVIPNFVDPSFERSGEADALVGVPDEPYIMYAGSLSKVKGLEPMLEAYARLDVRSRPPLLLVGYRGHEHLPALEQLPAGATLMTDLPRSAVAAAWQRSMFAVVPSICAEAFGLVALEAMVFGRPAVASDIGGLGELIDHEATGLLVRPGDVPRLSAAMERLARDTELRDRLGSRAAVVARRYRSEHVIPAVEALYRSLVQ